MNELITKEIVENSTTRVWDFGNSVLYDMCRNNFAHTEDDKIIAKIWLIGRAYSVAIERTKHKVKINDNFYKDLVVPKIINSEINSLLDNLKNEESLSFDILGKVLKAHFWLKKRIKEQITHLNNRSFCSKYLHFHLPNLYFIYDSRAVSAIAKITGDIPASIKTIYKSDDVDSEYAKFVIKCFLLCEEIKREFGINLTTRQLDNILVDIANNDLINKSAKSK